MHESPLPQLSLVLLPLTSTWPPSSIAHGAVSCPLPRAAVTISSSWVTFPSLWNNYFCVLFNDCGKFRRENRREQLTSLIFCVCSHSGLQQESEQLHVKSWPNVINTMWNMQSETHLGIILLPNTGKYLHLIFFFFFQNCSQSGADFLGHIILSQLYSADFLPNFVPLVVAWEARLDFQQRSKFSQSNSRVDTISNTSEWPQVPTLFLWD